MKRKAEGRCCVLADFKKGVFEVLHSIISFNDDRGVTIDFHRLKQKRPESVLNAVFKGFSEFESIYITEDMKRRCKAVTIHYTEYESTEANKTFECAFADFLQRYNQYKTEKQAIYN